MSREQSSKILTKLFLFAKFINIKIRDLDIMVVIWFKIKIAHSAISGPVTC